MNNRLTSFLIRPAVVASAGLALLLSNVSSAMAHPGHTGTGMVHGMMHPITGIDHILAMVAVGVLATQSSASTRGRSLWVLPLAFISAMILGGLMGMAHLPFYFVEHGILASILILGVVIALGTRMPLYAAAPLVAVLALFHGYAHGVESPATDSGLAFGAGFVMATAALHLLGMGLGLIMNKTTTPSTQPLAFRLAGIGIVVAGISQAMV